MEFFDKITEEEIINNSKIEHLYSHEFGNGRFFSVIFQDENGFEIKLASRTMMRVVYLKEKNDIEGLEIIKIVNGQEKQKVKFSKFNFEQLKTFLEFIAETDLKNLSERRTKITIANELNEETKEQIEKLFSNENGTETIKDILDKGIITSQDIVNTGYRKHQLNIFESLLNDTTFLESYQSENNCKGIENMWQFFFEKNTWIFGYGLNFIFNSPLNNKKLEQVISGFDFNSKGKRTDAFLKSTGIINSMCFVEIKKHDDNLLKQTSKSYRPESWQISDTISGGIAQLHRTLQKASKLPTKNEIKDEQDDLTNEIIFLHNPKAYLIVGNLQEFIKDEKINETKYSNFEFFRKELNNIEIITYDELLNRAKFIVSEQSEAKKEIDLDDLPF